jgi:hypothetical protein
MSYKKAKINLNEVPVDYFSLLPEAVFLSEIITRLPIVMYYPCKFVNKKWNRLIEIPADFVRHTVWKFVAKCPGASMAKFFGQYLHFPVSVYAIEMLYKVENPENLELLRWFKETASEHFLKRLSTICWLAGRYGRAGVLELDETRNHLIEFVMGAAYGGNLNMIELSIQKGYKPCYIDLLKEAVEGGQVNVVKWAGEKHDTLKKKDVISLLLDACVGGSVQVLQYLTAKLGGRLRFGPEMCSRAALHGNYELVVWLIEKGCETKNDIVDDAIVGGNIELANFLLSKNNYDIDPSTCRHLACSGSLKMLKWMYEKKYFNMSDESEILMQNAIANNHPHVIKWLYKECVYVWRGREISTAVDNGDISTVRTLRKLGCPWDDKCAYSIACSSDDEMIGWVKRNGFVWTRDFLDKNIEKITIEAFKNAVKHGCPYDRFTCFTAKVFYRRDIESFLHNVCKVNCEYNHQFDDDDPKVCYQICDQLAVAGKTKMFKWAVDAGCPYDRLTCYKAHSKNNNEIVRWLHESQKCTCSNLNDGTELI